METGSIFEKIGGRLPQEVVDRIVKDDNVRIERIVSWGHKSEDGFWYDQDENEWVIVLKGQARLRIKGKSELIHLREGMYINIAAHVQHRVEWTDPDGETIWLAVFYTAGSRFSES